MNICDERKREDYSVFQENLDNVVAWREMNGFNFNIKKCSAMSLTLNIVGHNYNIKDSPLKNSTIKRSRCRS